MRGRVPVTAALLALLFAAPAAHAALPSASTGGARDITQTSVLLKGSINPNSEATTWYFQYGTTKAFGNQTPVQGPTGATKGSMPVSAAVGGLSPATTYHYRLAATNASGTKFGGDKSFKTLKPAPTITLSASRPVIVFGSPTILSGQLTQPTGTSAAGVKITLHQDNRAVATATTDSTGHFSFTGSPPHNAIYFATAPTRPKATSGQVGVQVANRVTVRLSTAHPRRGHKVVFRGTVGPAHNGELVRIQKRIGSHWRTVKSAILGPVPGTARLSQYRVGIRIRRKGVYRAYVAGDATNVAGASRRRVITPR